MSDGVGMSLTKWQVPPPEAIPLRLGEFLESLPGPVAMRLPGEDSSRARVFTTLFHGNEFSGLEAVHQWLRAGSKPAVDTLIIIGAVEAALAEPMFFHRQLPGRRDLNRCFRPPFAGPEGRLAQSILECIREARPEAVVDMHNTSGSSAAFTVAIGDDPAQRALAGLFTRRLIVTDLRLGALMEQEFGCPVVTVEAGGSRDEAAAVVAGAGLRNYFTAQSLFFSENEKSAPAEDKKSAPGLAPDIEVYRHPLRLELTPRTRIDYATSPLPDRDITMRADIEKYNFTAVGPEDDLAWLGEGGLSHLRVGSGGQGREVLEFFRIEGGSLRPAHPMRLFMATTRADIATSDCLFYFCGAGDSQGGLTGELTGGDSALAIGPGRGYH